MYTFLRINIISLLLSPGLLVGQNQLPDFSPASLTQPIPEAYALGKYGFSPIGQYTGSQNISIPLYGLEFEGRTFPIRLDYNYSGHQVNEESSWIGLGWALTSNGIITRAVNDKDDFGTVVADGGGRYSNGWINQPDILPNGLVNAIDYLPSQVRFLIEEYDGDHRSPDTEPDLFVANIFGETLKFVLQQKALNGGVVGVKVLNRPTYKVSFDETEMSFDVTDDVGFVYHFNTKSRSDSYGSSPASYDIINSWFLDKVIAPSGKELTFEYRQGSDKVRLPVVASYYINKEICRLGATGNLPTHLRNGGTAIETVSEAVYLTQIENGKETLLFTLANRTDLQAEIGSPKRLSAIDVKYSGITKKTIDLAQSYMGGSLRLDRISIEDEIYDFEYFSKSNPGDNTKAIDLWGFYNGKSTNSVYYPRMNIEDFCVTPSGQTVEKTILVEGANKEANFSRTVEGALRKITYPTGGSTEYVYELNTVKMLSTEYEAWEFPVFNTTTLDESGDYFMNVSPSVTFSQSSRSPAYLSITLRDWDGPYNGLYDELYPHRNRKAFQLISPSNTVVYDIKIGDFLEWCYNDADNEQSCDQANNFCYCSNSDHYFTGHLSKGLYKLKLFDLSDINFRVQATFRAPNREYRNKAVGGIRVKSVVDRDLNHQKVGQRDYEYDDEDSYSSGTLMNQPVYYKIFEYWNNDGSSNIDCFGGALGSGASVRLYDITSYANIGSIPTSPISRTAQGSHVGYSKVKEKFISTLDNSNSYSILTNYYNDPTTYDPSIGNYGFLNIVGVIPSISDNCLTSYHAIKTMPEIYTKSFATKNGKPLEHLYYNSENKLVKAVENTYALYENSAVGAIKIVYGANAEDHSGNLSGTGNTRTVIGGYLPYLFQTEAYLLTGSDVTYYHQDNEYILSKSLSYNDGWLQSRISEENSSGEFTVSKYAYSNDFDVGIPFIDDLTARNMTALPVRIDIIKNGEQTEGRIIEYNEYGLVEEVNELVTDTPIPPIDKHDINNEVYQPNGKYSYYNSTSKVKQFISRSGVPTTYLWGYEDRYVVAKVVGATYDEVNGIIDQTILDSPSGDMHLSTELQRLRDAPSLLHAEVTTYTISPLEGITSMTDPNGQTSYFEYDQSGRLRLSKDDDGHILQLNEYYLNNQ
ncbi:MAG: hypothetical protein AAF693_20850 [Bacteroidota bacterium]